VCKIVVGQKAGSIFPLQRLELGIIAVDIRTAAAWCALLFWLFWLGWLFWPRKQEITPERSKWRYQTIESCGIYRVCLDAVWCPSLLCR
jgi:hypothetical protein